MKKITLLLLTLIIALSVKAQEGYKEASIVYRNGNTEKGLVKFYGMIDPNKIIFKKNGETNEKVISPNLISSCLFTEINREILSEIIDGKYQFVETIVKGKSNLLFYVEKKGKKRYFLKSDKSGLKELTIAERYVKDYGGARKLTIKQYVGILSLDFNDCSAITSKIEHTKLQLRSLANIFEAYNKCLDNSAQSSERLKRKESHKIGIEVGMNFTETQNEDVVTLQDDFDKKNVVDFGITYIYTPAIFSSRVAIETGISYFKLSTQRVLIDQNGNRPNKIDLTTINHTLGFSYTFLKEKNKLRPFISLLYSGSIALDKENIYKRTTPEGEQPVFDKYDVKTYALGYSLNMGIAYKIVPNQEIRFKLGYNNIGDHSSRGELGYLVSGYYLKLAYSIKL